MKFCPVVPEICRGQVHGPRKERRKRRKRRIRIRIIIIRNGAKTISPRLTNDIKTSIYSAKTNYVVTSNISTSLS
jgi:hypothetical protein